MSTPTPANGVRGLLAALLLLVLLPLSPRLAWAAQPAKTLQAKGPTQSVTYTDAWGRHELRLSVSEVYQTGFGEDQSSHADLSASDTLLDPVSPKLLWQMRDGVHQCTTSVTAEFSPDSPRITDLDANGLSEVWLIYYVGCHGDVSPDGMKLLMYEGGRKHALRGETRVHVDGEDLGGSYVPDPAFQRAPAVLRQEADRLWRTHRTR